MALPIPEILTQAAEPFEDSDSAPIDALLQRIGSARVVLLGEATHGSSEFYRMRARITRELIEHHGFDFIAVEADWPDAQRIDTYVRHLDIQPPDWRAFARFPTWMWRNTEVHEFVQWLRGYNTTRADTSQRVGFHGLDLYSMFSSIGAVLDYLEGVDPETAALARECYGCLSPWPTARPMSVSFAAVSLATTPRWSALAPITAPSPPPMTGMGRCASSRFVQRSMAAMSVSATRPGSARSRCPCAAATASTVMPPSLAPCAAR